LNDSIREVEDAFDASRYDLVEEDEAHHDEGLMAKITKQLPKSTSLYFHTTIAMTLNVFAVLSVKPFNLLPMNTIYIFLIMSAISTYRHIFNYKSYTVHEFEDIYQQLKKKSMLQKEAF
jgi:hypothetical protein